MFPRIIDENTFEVYAIEYSKTVFLFRVYAEDLMMLYTVFWWLSGLFVE